MNNIIVLAIIATSLATYLSRFLGVISSEKINIVTPLNSRINFLIKDYKSFINKKLY